MASLLDLARRFVTSSLFGSSIAFAERKEYLALRVVPDVICYVIFTYFCDEFFGVVGMEVNRHDLPLAVRSHLEQLRIEKGLEPLSYIVNEKNRSNKKIQKLSNGLDSSSFGFWTIQSTSNVICRWDLKVGPIRDRGIVVGIASDYSRDRAFHRNRCSSNYSYSAFGNICENGRDQAFQSGWHWNANGETVCVELNLMERKVAFYRDGKQHPNQCRDIAVASHIAYKMGCFIYERGVDVEIIDFKLWTA